MTLNINQSDSFFPVGILREARSIRCVSDFTRRLTSACAVLAVLAGCTETTISPPQTSPSAALPSSQEALDPLFIPPESDPAAQARYYGGLYQKNPKDSEVAFQYGRALRRAGQVQNAVPVLEQALRMDSSNAAISAEYGKGLTASGRVEEGIGHLLTASQLNPEDWTIHSALGIAYDQLGRHDDARLAYQRALEVSPSNPNILNNLGLSAALSGDLVQAENYLRRAVALPSSSSQHRQNLALVLAYAGKFDEAEQLARGDLPPDIAEKNLAYIKSRLSEPSRWQELENLDSQRVR